MKSVAVLLGLIALPVTYVAQSADIADVSTNYLEQLYDINMELLVDGEIISAPRIVLKVGGRGSMEFSSENGNYTFAVQTEPSQIESGTVVIPVSFDFKSDTAYESRTINTSVDMPLGQTVSLIGKTTLDGDVQLNASIDLMAAAPNW